MSLLTQMNPRPFMPAGNPIEFIYSSTDAIPTPQNYEVWKLDISGNTDLCGKKLTILGKDYFFVVGGQDDPRAFAFFLNPVGSVCGGAILNTFCEIAASIATGINNNVNTNDTYICLPVGEVVQITNAPLYAISECNEAVAPYVTLFIMAKKSGIGLGLTTNSTDISLTLLQSGTTGLVSNEPYKAITSIEVEQGGHRSGSFVRCPLFNALPSRLPNPSLFNNSINQQSSGQIVGSLAKGFATNNTFFFRNDVQSACRLFFAEDLPKLDGIVRQCLKSIKNVRAKKSEYYAGAYTKAQRADRTGAGANPNADYIFAVLNAQFDSYKNSLYISRENNATYGCMDLYNYPYPLQPYFEGVVKFMQSAETKNIGLSDYEWLYFYNILNGVADLSIVADVTYSQPVDLGMGYVTSAQIILPFDVSILDCEYSGQDRGHIYQVPIHSIFALVEQPESVRSVCVWIQGLNLPELEPTRITSKFTYEIAQTCSPQTFLFQNHLGQFETIFFTDATSEGMELEHTKLTTYANAGILKNEYTLETLPRKTYEFETASTTEMLQIEAILQSPSIYWIEKKLQEYTRCNCFVSECEQEARNLMDIWQAYILAYWAATPIDLCGTGSSWFGVFNGDLDLLKRYQNSQCYTFSSECVDVLGDTIIYIIATPLSPNDRAYITMFILAGPSLNLLAELEADAPDTPIPPLVGGSPAGFHAGYQDFAGRCSQTIATETLTPMAILDKSILLKDIKNELAILRIRFEKQENLALEGGTNE